MTSDRATRGESAAPFPSSRPSEEYTLFAHELGAANLDEVTKLYPALLQSSQLEKNNVRKIAQLIHSTYRRDPEQKPRLQALLEFADTLVRDTRKQALPSSPYAYLHLLSFFKEARQYERGYEFWSWLAKQDDEYVNPAVYGAAIELLAYHGQKLGDLEQMYVSALKRFPGTFSEYHLSPRAIVPDRAAPMIFPGLHMTLLQGILTARILHGDWRNAYLALDTALRLFPTQVPHRFFELFLYERPLAEGYQVFLLACRSGVNMTSHAVTRLLDKIASLKPGPFESSTNGVILVRAMLNAIDAHQRAGGKLHAVASGIVIKALGDLLLSRSFTSCNSSDRERIVDVLLDTVRETIKLFASHGIPPSLSTFNNIISAVAGRTGRIDIIENVLRDASAVGLEPDEITRRAILVAAGDMRDMELLAASWQKLVEANAAKGLQPQAPDWLTLARAASKLNNAAFVEEQKVLFAHTLTQGMNTKIQRELDRAKARGPEVGMSDSLSTAAIEDGLRTILAHVLRMSKSVADGHQPSLYESPVAMSIDMSRSILADTFASEQELMSLYDELTTDARQYRQTRKQGDPSQILQGAPSVPRQHPDSRPQEEVQSPIATSPTGFPLDKLRYENWKSINELLLEADIYETQRQHEVDQAMKSGAPVPRRDYGLGTRSWVLLYAKAAKGERFVLPDETIAKQRITRAEAKAEEKEPGTETNGTTGIASDTVESLLADLDGRRLVLRLRGLDGSSAVGA
ncbi:hypothetical protein B0A49_03224 [Cryomyces minteri]|uniref:Uncharacterized protein n=1 Tax=Cryomyces minteri TaxID=331657 RepID=A0A4V5NIJ7_9PEZI|nr:hypothetical protein B0A49_03224 [Cryomyces minteri]